MPSFDTESKERLKGVYYPLVGLFDHVVQEYDCTVLFNGGHRGKDIQNQLYPTYSKVKFPFSRHNAMVKDDAGQWQPLALAVDVAPYHKTTPHVDWNDRDSFYHFAGYVRGQADYYGIPITWGGDWDGDFDLADQQFYDLAHFQIDINQDRYAAKVWEDFVANFRE